MHRLLRFSLFVFLILVVSFGIGRAEPADAAAMGLRELVDIQRAVKLVLPAATAALVGLETDDGAASGVIVSPDGLILTAAHVVTDIKQSPRAGGRLRVCFSDGHKSWATALGVDVATDAGMAKLDGKRIDWPFVPIHAAGAVVNPGEWCFALGHPGGYDFARGAVLRMGRILKSSANSLQSDCVLMGGDSGGPLFNLQGELIGIHSQIWEGRDQNVHVSLAPFYRSWDKLRSSEVVRVWGQGSGGWLGVNTAEVGDGGLKVQDVAPDSPAARAGLRSGDVLMAMDKRWIRSRAEFSDHLKARPAGDSVVLLVKNRSGERIVTVKLATRPEN